MNGNRKGKRDWTLPWVFNYKLVNVKLTHLKILTTMSISKKIVCLLTRYVCSSYFLSFTQCASSLCQSTSKLLLDATPDLWLVCCILDQGLWSDKLFALLFPCASVWWLNKKKKRVERGTRFHLLLPLLLFHHGLLSSTSELLPSHSRPATSEITTTIATSK